MLVPLVITRAFVSVQTVRIETFEQLQTSVLADSSRFQKPANAKPGTVMRSLLDTRK
jgi:hypothetical protein